MTLFIRGVCRGYNPAGAGVWETPVMTLSDATKNTYGHKGSYSNTIN